ncbi:uncharacterized protein BKA55DRAFT_553547 [Fusarium redolens]|uniref:Uncharacterized protein n=1 Tax=Fusarium redolens TaxID=48865 RepID=A0A9P9KR24_FUSRE|nr:uncharacterized protein BKA55DRAFT_553547 [Fusarium redolens]KAH7266870.1 hypothetical protein BKA55DRAFT_553547 [Fusarium redolens]
MAIRMLGCRASMATVLSPASVASQTWSVCTSISNLLRTKRHRCERAQVITHVIRSSSRAGPWPAVFRVCAQCHRSRG